MRADSTISSSSVGRRAVLVVSEAAIDSAVSGIVQGTRLAVVDDLAVPHRDDAIGIALGELEVMDGTEDGDAVLLIHIAEIVENDHGCFGVEACHGLVGEKDLRLLRQGARERDSLLLASGGGVRGDGGLFGTLLARGGVLGD